MSSRHGRNTYVSFDGVDISGFCDTSELGQTVDTDETSVYGPQNKSYIPGQVDGTFTFGGRYDDGSSNTPRTLCEAAIDGDAAVPIVRRTEGTGSGRPEQSFSAIVTSYVETNPVGGKIAFSCDTQVTGAITRSTQS